jgi:prepilin-type N-terminal cleavage/methylation domain-containing protein
MSSVTPRGFSFIELLVAILVIVLLTGVVSLNVGRGGAELQLDGEVRYLANLLSFSGDEAELSAADHGLLIAFDSTARNTRYQGIWLRRFEQGWASPRAGTEVFVPFVFMAGTELLLNLEGQPSVEIPVYDPTLKTAPQIIMWAGGEVTPGSIEWLDDLTGELLYRLEWDLLGRMNLLPNGEPPIEE